MALLSGMFRPRLLLLAIVLTLSILYWTFLSSTFDYDAKIGSNPLNKGLAQQQPIPSTAEKGRGQPNTQSPIKHNDPEPPVEDKPVCKSFETLQMQKPGPASEGKRKFPLVRPPPECRTFKLPALEALLARLKKKIKDPDLFRLFENSYPNTLDTMVKWRGHVNETDEKTGKWRETDEELTYVITGDIDAMWLRDSASQIYSYLPLLEASKDPNSLASLWRGLINSHARYIIISPYCHSFQPPKESGILPTHNGAFTQNNPQPPYDPKLVFDCKWELDSLASFLQISSAYYHRTKDAAFFGKYKWVEAVAAAVKAAGAMRKGTYDKDGKVLPSAWTFTGWTNRGSETLTNDGLGNPSKENGMVRTGFRPSDDACIYQFLVPANMMFAKYLEDASFIVEDLAKNELYSNVSKAEGLAEDMRRFAFGIRKGIDKDAVVNHRDFGDVFAYEVDGFGSTNMMDDANIPSLLAMPLFNYSHSSLEMPPAFTKAASVAGDEEEEKREDEEDEEEGDDSTSKSRNKRMKRAPVAKASSHKSRDLAKVYQNTRKFILSDANPYWAKGPVLSAVGGPHLGPGKGWPMAAVVAAMTAYDPVSGLSAAAAQKEVAKQLQQVLDSTAGTGVMHETVHAFHENTWTRAWFGWANGLFGELILRIEEQEEKESAKGEGLLARSWQ